MPMRRAVAATRQAISPRLAISILVNMVSLFAAYGWKFFYCEWWLVFTIGPERARLAWRRSAAALFIRRRIQHRAARAQAQFAQQRAVVLGLRVLGGQQLVAVEDRVGAGQEAHRLHRLAHLAAAGRQAHARLRHRDAGHG